MRSVKEPFKSFYKPLNINPLTVISSPLNINPLTVISSPLVTVPGKPLMQPGMVTVGMGVPACLAGTAGMVDRCTRDA